MYRAIVALVDAARARLFTFERSTDDVPLADELVEQRDLVNPARRRRPSELFSDSFAFDDHRDAHIDELDAEFARQIAGELTSLLAGAPAPRIVLCATPRMLGALRVATRDLRRSVAIDDAACDLVKLAVPQLRDRLAAYGLLPPRVVAPLAFAR